MTRRAMAMILLFVAVATSASQGLSAALCRCTGHVFIGSAPESCCGECPEEESSASATQLAGQPSLSTHGYERCLLGAKDCFISVSKGWETYPPTNGKEQVPTPAVTAAESLADLMPPVPQYMLLTSMSSWNLIHQPEPPGLSRVLLYRSLLI